MGNAQSVASTRLAGAGELVGDGPLQYECSLGLSRFLRATRVRHPVGQLVVKTFIKPNTEMRLRGLVRRLQVEREALEDVPNVLTYQQVIETDLAGYLVRQWLMSSLYDRISTRPFLATVEKLWISYQLLYAMRASSECKVAHGDLKTENVLVTSSLAVYITDFASSFKPTYLPLDDPTDFSLFFDTSGRRTCYIAPERFYDTLADLPRGAGNSATRPPSDVENVSDVLTHEPYLEALGLGRPNGRITETMDVFSLGCVLAELWRDGAPLFTLSQLFRYRAGLLDISGTLAEIPHDGMRALIARMLAPEADARPSFRELLEEESCVFPDAFSAFLHLYLVDLQRPSTEAIAGTADGEHAGPAPSGPQPAAPARPQKTGQFARALEPDDRIEKLYDDWAAITPFFGATGSSALDLPPTPIGVHIPSTAVPPLNAPRAEAHADGVALVVLTVLLANVRHCRRATSRAHALDMIMHACVCWLSDEVCLDRVLPYLVALLGDAQAACRARAIAHVSVLLARTQSVPGANAGLCTEYVFPHLQQLAHDPSALVRVTLARELPGLARSALRLLRLETLDQARRHTAEGVTYDEETRRPQDAVQAQLVALLADADAHVRRAALAGVGPLAVLLGEARVQNVVLAHVLAQMGDADWRLRAAVFPAVADLAPVLGTHVLARYVQPLLEQALSEADVSVLADALRALARLVRDDLLMRTSLWALLQRTVGFLSHPDLWVREACVGLFAAVAARHAAVDSWATLYLLVRPLLRCDILVVTEGALLANLAAPLDDATLQAAVGAVRRGDDTFIAYWQTLADRAWCAATPITDMVRAHVGALVHPSPVSPFPAPALPATADEKAMLARFAVCGYDARHDAPKVAALWWYIVACAHEKRRAPHDAPPENAASLDGIPQHTIFFTPRPDGKAAALLPSDLAVRMARARIAGGEPGNEHLGTVTGGRRAERGGADGALCPTALGHPGGGGDGGGDEEERDPMTRGTRTPSDSVHGDAGALAVESESARHADAFTRKTSATVHKKWVANLSPHGWVAAASEHGPAPHSPPPPALQSERVRAATARTPSTSPTPTRPTTPPSRPSSLQLLRTQPAKAAASTSFVHAHASRSAALPGAPSARRARGGAAGAPPASPEAHTATPRPAYDSTYDGCDPYREAHLQLVYERLSTAHTQPLHRLLTGTVPRAWTPSSRTPATTTSNRRPEGTLIAYFTEHKAAITALAVSGDERFFVSGDAHGPIKVWDTARLEKNVTSRSRVTYAGHKARITTVCIVSGTHCVVSTSCDGAVHAWGVAVDTASSVPQYRRAQILGRVRLADGEYVTAATQAAHGAAPIIAFGTNTGRLLFWDVRSMRAVRTLRGSTAYGAITSLALDCGRRWLCAGTARGVLRLWDLRFELCVRSWSVGASPRAPAPPASDAAITACVPHPTRPRSVFVAYEGGGRTLFDLFDLERGAVVHTFRVEEATARDALHGSAYAQDVRAPVSGAQDAPKPVSGTGNADAAPRAYTLLPEESSEDTATAALAALAAPPPAHQANATRAPTMLLASTAGYTSSAGPASSTDMSSGWIDVARFVSGTESAQSGGSMGSARTDAVRPWGYVLSAGADRQIRFWDLGRPAQSICISPDRHKSAFDSSPGHNGEPACTKHVAPAPSAPALHAPGLSHERTKATSAFVKSHKDAITALAVIELPFRCIVAGDRAGTIRVWE
ncbi:non-specific serine/threonine protein kinase [Malassezia sp. CBS 17886]|nr:non-specific serine/threonine protein kinase [Malassezia sp. CBS 17886]